MPHFVVDCSEDILTVHTESTINQKIHDLAYSTGLFDEGDIKVRVNPFKSYLVGNKKEAFIHVFSHIMEGRTVKQKANLSTVIVEALNKMFPEVANIAMNVTDFEKLTYCNKNQLD